MHISKVLSKILIVDDLEDYLRSLRRALASEWMVVCAQSVAAAKEALQTENIEAALIDVRLSESDPQNRDGVVLLKWIQAQHPLVPVVMMSAYTDFDAAVDALNLGAVQFLRKPIDLRIVREVLRSLIPQR